MPLTDSPNGMPGRARSRRDAPRPPRTLVARPGAQLPDSPRRGLDAPFALVRAGRRPLPLQAEVTTVGRGTENTITLADPAVSRRHARISYEGGGLQIADLGSAHGTWVDGARISRLTALTDGSQIRLGDDVFVVRRRRAPNESSATIVVPELPAGESAATNSTATSAVQLGDRPRLRPGYAVKRLAASEGARRYVIKDLRTGTFIRLTRDDERLVKLLDGSRSLPELVGDAEAQLGNSGGAQLARLLAELADRGLLDGIEGQRQESKPGGLFRPREWIWDGAGEVFDRLYRAGFRQLVSPTAVLVAAVLTVAGVLLFPYLVLARYGTPFVVVSHLGLGGAVFLVGRLCLGVVHETAHALVLASFGRRVGRSGLKLVLVFPYFFIDTSDAWFERRRRRIAVSAAGPVSDLALAGVFSIASVALPPSPVRDVLFQLAFAAYVGGLFNLNPFLERDGYHILADLLSEPRLRQRAQAQLRDVLAGRPVERSGLLMRYAIGGLVWSAAGSLFAIVMSLRYQSTLATIVPAPAVWPILVACWLVFFMPVLIIFLPALVQRRRNAPA
jgi:pSer/pThr/pTyr-binding forkhead associated (FHA) protein/Zn-dependent protease